MEDLNPEERRILLEGAYIASAAILATAVGVYHAWKGQNEVHLNAILFVVLVVGGWIFLTLSGM